MQPAMSAGNRTKSLLTVKLKQPDTPLALRGAGSGHFGNTSSSIQQRPHPRSARGDWEVPLKDKNGRHIDQPVTFHSKIKSSGYGQVPQDSFLRKKLQQQKLRMRSTSAPRNPSASSTSSGDSAKKNKITLYPLHGTAVMKLHQPHLNFPPSKGSVQPAVVSIAFSPDASQLAVASADSTLLAVKLPTSGEANAFMGHNNRVCSACFSHHTYPPTSSSTLLASPPSQHLLLSSSADGSARLWQQSKMDCPLVVFNHYRHQASGPASTSSLDHSTSIRNKPFADCVNSANFFFLDKFVLLTVKSSVLMYTYEVERASARNDLKVLQSAALSAGGRYKLVHEWNFSEPSQCHSVSAVGCVNQVQSPIILTATSDKMLQVLDAAVGCVARHIPSPHDRSIHCIALPQPSIHVPLLLDAYNMFATSAIDNLIVLWDIRAPRSVARYSSHVNRRESVQAAISPCLRYVATGSEDRSARILDVRTGKELERLAGVHDDVVSSVAFHPLDAQLASGSYDGQVRFYCDPSRVTGRRS